MLLVFWQLMFENEFFLQILVHFCFFLHMYEKALFSLKDSQNSCPSETKVSSWFINLPSEYESAIFNVLRG